MTTPMTPKRIYCRFREVANVWDDESYGLERVDESDIEYIRADLISTWVSVEDALPERGCHYSYVPAEVNKYRSCFHLGEGKWETESGYLVKVTHWFKGVPLLPTKEEVKK
jgi:hypothetical protein